MRNTTKTTNIKSNNRDYKYQDGKENEDDINYYNKMHNSNNKYFTDDADTDNTSQRSYSADSKTGWDDRYKSNYINNDIMKHIKSLPVTNDNIENNIEEDLLHWR